MAILTKFSHPRLFNSPAEGGLPLEFCNSDADLKKK